MEHFSSQEHPNLFIFPDLQNETGEIERTGEHFGVHDERFVEKFIQKAHHSDLVSLSSEIWEILENTDSVDIQEKDWAVVENTATQTERDWRTLRSRLEAGDSLDAPVVARFGDTHHLVSGNTRLMVAKALGVTPKVLIVDITHLL